MRFTKGICLVRDFSVELGLVGHLGVATEGCYATGADVLWARHTGLSQLLDMALSLLLSQGGLLPRTACEPNATSDKYVTQSQS